MSRGHWVEGESEEKGAFGSVAMDGAAVGGGGVEAVSSDGRLVAFSALGAEGGIALSDGIASATRCAATIGSASRSVTNTTRSGAGC